MVDDEQRIILRGRQEYLKPLITEILALNQILKHKDIGTVYAYNDDLESVKRVGKPKVTLFFLEDTNFNKVVAPDNTAKGKRRQEGVIRFRLMNESTSTFSKANAQSIARKVKEIFGANGGYVWKKGKTLYSYNDWELGYQFQLLCRSETEAKRIINSVLSIQMHTPQWFRFNKIENDDELTTYPENPGNQTVMGESMPKPKLRPLVDVRFRYAYVKLDGLREPINLFDRTGQRVDALER